MDPVSLAIISKTVIAVMAILVGGVVAIYKL